MRRIALLIGLIVGCHGAPRASSLSAVIAPHASAFAATSSVEISASAVGGVDAGGNLLVLINVQNTSNERLALSGGGADDDWYDAFVGSVEAADNGFGGSHFVTDQAVPGDRACTAPEYALVLPPGGTLGRLQRIAIAPGLPHGVPHVQIRVRIPVTSSALACGPLRVLVRNVDVAFEPGASIASPSAPPE